MANKVFANMMEVSCKAASGKSICAFPDVCMTPPQTPATPPGVPIPYPNTGMASDCTDGSSSVKISGQEVMLKNKSYFKRSSGDEAGCAPKKNLITSKTMGKVYFKMWSMDVKFEGENVVRHLDITTHNHASEGPGTPPMPHASMMSPGWDSENCGGEIGREKEACSEFEPHKEGKKVCEAAEMMAPVLSLSGDQHLAKAQAIQRAPKPADAKTDKEKALGCLRARRCRLVPYDPKDPAGIKGCCPSQTPDHILPKASFYVAGYKKGKGDKQPGWDNYKPDDAPCMCAEGPSNSGKGSHPLRHAYHKAIPPAGVSAGDEMPFDTAATHSTNGASEVFKGSECSEKCVKAQLVEQHKPMAKNAKNLKPVRYKPSGTQVTDAQARASAAAFNTGLAPGGR